VVFRKPTDTSVDYVKRIVGLPGDRIQMINGVLNINGTAVAMERETLAPEYYAEAPYVFYRETLPGGRSYVIADVEEDGYGDDTVEFLVPEGHFYSLGDNRDNSADSRVPEVGFVPFDNLIGPVAIRLFNAGNLPLDTRPIEYNSGPGLGAQ
jgi:signal peptidase I